MSDFDLVYIGWVLALAMGKGEWARIAESKCSTDAETMLEILGTEISVECPVISTLVSSLPLVIPPLEGKVLSESKY